LTKTGQIEQQISEITLLQSSAAAVSSASISEISPAPNEHENANSPPSSAEPFVVDPYKDALTNNRALNNAVYQHKVHAAHNEVSLDRALNMLCVGIVLDLASIEIQEYKQFLNTRYDERSLLVQQTADNLNALIEEVERRCLSVSPWRANAYVAGTSVCARRTKRQSTHCMCKCTGIFRTISLPSRVWASAQCPSRRPTTTVARHKSALYAANSCRQRSDRASRPTAALVGKFTFVHLASHNTLLPILKTAAKSTFSVRAAMQRCLCTAQCQSRWHKMALALH
jgi:hypothetical protein